LPDRRRLAATSIGNLPLPAITATLSPGISRVAARRSGVVIDRIVAPAAKARGDEGSLAAVPQKIDDVAHGWRLGKLLGGGLQVFAEGS
jgi:hypothetical protein